MSPTTTAFVLSGGGSLGAVQVGMLQALDAHGIHPDLLVGISAGAVNALWVAEHGMSAGSLARLASIWEGLRRKDVFPVTAAHLLQGLVGRRQALCDSDQLGSLVRTHCGVGDLAETSIPVHLVATDLLSGKDVMVSSGPPDQAVRASAAIPGVFAPVLVDGRWLVDGALAAHAGVAQAVQLGATEVYVLPAGVPCALADPPRSALGVTTLALTFLIEQRLISEVMDPPPGAAIRLVPPLCPVSVSAADFSHGAELIGRARRASLRWLERGGPELPEPARFLSLHHHLTEPRR